MGIANLQQGLGGAAQDFSRAQISGLGTLGSAQQAQNQAVLDAQRQAAQMAVQDPQRRLNMLGSGVMGLMGGMGAGRTEIGEAPAAAQSSPLMTALGVGLAGADIYGRLFGGRN
jgi:ABC-type sugar transport system ATPase subunit